MANVIHGSTEAKQPKLFCWSTHDEKGIARLCKSYAQYVSSIESHRISADNDKSLLNDLWYTLAHRRSLLGYKSWCIASTIDELHQKLVNGISRPIRSSKSPQVAFVFTGQGAQWHAMGQELWTYEVYRKSIQQADAYLASAGSSWSVIGMKSPCMSGLCILSNLIAVQRSSIKMLIRQSSMKPSIASPCALLFRSLLYSSYDPGISNPGQSSAIPAEKLQPLTAWVACPWSQHGSWPINVDNFRSSSKPVLGP